VPLGLSHLTNGIVNPTATLKAMQGDADAALCAQYDAKLIKLFRELVAILHEFREIFAQVKELVNVDEFYDVYRHGSLPLRYQEIALATRSGQWW
jgi:hypothetical protein